MTQLSRSQTRAIRTFELANVVCAGVLLAGAALAGFGHLTPGGLIGAAAAAVNIRLSRRIFQRFLEFPQENQLAVARQLSVKTISVLACVGGLVYLRPDLAPGMALGYTSILPASLVLAVRYSSGKLE